MKNILLLTATTALCAIPSFSMSSVPTAPVGTVTVIEEEIEVEFLPAVVVEVVHSEVVINGQNEG